MNAVLCFGIDFLKSILEIAMFFTENCLKRCTDFLSNLGLIRFQLLFFLSIVIPPESVVPEYDVLFSM